MDRESALGGRRGRALVALLVALTIVAVVGICAQQAFAASGHRHEGAMTCSASQTAAKETTGTATIAIDTVTPRVVKVKGTVALSGGVTPIDTAATSVAWVVEFKKGGTWVQVKAGNADLGFLGGAMRFSFTYKPMKKGSYRSQASFFNLIGGSKTTSAWVKFRAK